MIRPRASQQVLAIEILDPGPERLIFSVQHTGLLRIQFAQNNEIAVLEFLGGRQAVQL